MLHRDLKPDNVLVTEFNRGKIADFGTSRAKAASDDAIMTAVGTPLFAAPELHALFMTGAPADFGDFLTHVSAEALGENVEGCVCKDARQSFCRISRTHR